VGEAVHDINIYIYIYIYINIAVVGICRALLWQQWLHQLDVTAAAQANCCVALLHDW
jgi:hypothetical protein